MQRLSLRKEMKELEFHLECIKRPARTERTEKLSSTRRPLFRRPVVMSSLFDRLVVSRCVLRLLVMLMRITLPRTSGSATKSSLACGRTHARTQGATMEGGGSFIALPLGLMFFFSGFIINALQLLSVLLVLPLSRRAYRVVNMIMMEALWSELIWLLDWWAGVKVRVYTDRQSWEQLGKEHALVISNHRSDIDWLVGWIIAQRLGCLGGTRAVMKKSTKFLPVIGWSMWFSEYVFLSRNWSKDEKVLKDGYASLKGFPRTLWVALFVEGTRFTKAKLEAAQKYAADAGLRVPRHVLVPRTKGFVSAVENLREFVPAVYDMTVAVSKELPDPTMIRIFRGQPSVVRIHLRRVPMSELPQGADEISKWCHDAFHIKDDRLEQHEEENTFGEDLYIPIARPLGPLIIVITWAITLLAASWWLLRPILTTWKGVAWVAGVLLAVMMCVQVLIISSQSERSSDPAARRAKQKQSVIGNDDKKD